jgi:hypothetical protein
MFVPFPPESANDANSHPSGTYLTSLGNLATVLDAAIQIGTPTAVAFAEPILYNRVTAVKTPITQAFARSLWGTQRSRGDYGRPNQSPI